MPTVPRILILTSGPLCRNPRVLKEAQGLGSAGFDVAVMTVANLARFEVYDDELLRGAPFRKIALDLLSPGPVARARQLAERTGTWLARKAARRGWESAQAFGPYYALRHRARNFAADLTIAHTEVALCVAHHLLSHGRRVAADFEDWHSEDLLPTAQSGRPRRLLRRIEGELVRRATYVSTPSQAMAQALDEAFGGPAPVVITNSFPLQPRPVASTPDQPPAFFWFSQTIGPARGLEEFLDAWSLTRTPSRVCLLGDIAPEYRGALRHRLTADKRTQLEFLPLVAPTDLPAVIARHDIGLALESSALRSRDLTITNKILQYLNAGLCLVASETQGQREVLARAPAAGILVDTHNPGAFAAQLESLLSDRGRLQAARVAARRAAEGFYCWERETPQLLRAVESALAAPIPKS